MTILAAVEAARLDLDPAAEPGRHRAGRGVRHRGPPVAAARRRARSPPSHPDVHLQIHEHEPAEALDLLAADDIDLALTYDYNLAPATLRRDASRRSPLWEADWGLGVPAADRGVRGTAAEVLGRYRDSDWIVNSRNNADTRRSGTVASLAGFAPRVVHRADSLELVEDLIVAGLGVGLLPAGPAARRRRAGAAAARPAGGAAGLRRRAPRPHGLAAARPGAALARAPDQRLTIRRPPVCPPRHGAPPSDEPRRTRARAVP